MPGVRSAIASCLSTLQKTSGVRAIFPTTHGLDWLTAEQGGEAHTAHVSIVLDKPVYCKDAAGCIGKIDIVPLLNKLTVDLETPLEQVDRLQVQKDVVKIRRKMIAVIVPEVAENWDFCGKYHENYTDAKAMLNVLDEDKKSVSDIISQSRKIFKQTSAIDRRSIVMNNLTKKQFQANIVVKASGVDKSGSPADLYATLVSFHISLANDTLLRNWVANRAPIKNAFAPQSAMMIDFRYRALKKAIDSYKKILAKKSATQTEKRDAFALIGARKLDFDNDVRAFGIGDLGDLEWTYHSHSRAEAIKKMHSQDVKDLVNGLKSSTEKKAAAAISKADVWARSVMAPRIAQTVASRQQTRAQSRGVQQSRGQQNGTWGSQNAN